MLKAWPEEVPERVREVLLQRLERLGEAEEPVLLRVDPTAGYLQDDYSVKGRGLEVRGLPVDQYGRRHFIEGVEVARIALLAKDGGPAARGCILVEVWPYGEEVPWEFSVCTFETAAWIVNTLARWEGPTEGLREALYLAAEHRDGEVTAMRLALGENERIFGGRAIEVMPEFTWADGAVRRGDGWAIEYARKMLPLLRRLAPMLPIADDTGLGLLA